MTNTNDMEHERRFLVSEMPSVSVERVDYIQQFYFFRFKLDEDRQGAEISIDSQNFHVQFPKSIPDELDKDKLVFRQRILNNNNTIFTLKGPKHEGKGYELEWNPTDIRLPSLLSSDVSIINKKRYHILEDGIHIELDEFLDRHSGLMIAEVENPPENFIKPEWFGREITDDHKYSNVSLSHT